MGGGAAAAVGDSEPPDEALEDPVEGDQGTWGKP